MYTFVSLIRRAASLRDGRLSATANHRAEVASKEIGDKTPAARRAGFRNRGAIQFRDVCVCARGKIGLRREEQNRRVFCLRA